MSKKDPYFQHLNDEIAKHQKALDEAIAARAHYLRFNPTSAGTNSKVGRKGLRSEGRSRDLFEYFNAYSEGVEFALAEAESGYTAKEIQQFLHRYRAQGLVDIRGDKIFITVKGKALIDASQPYTGTRKG